LSTTTIKSLTADGTEKYGEVQTGKLMGRLNKMQQIFERGEG
jgi:hypothetical protein